MIHKQGLEHKNSGFIQSNIYRSNNLFVRLQTLCKTRPSRGIVNIYLQHNTLLESIIFCRYVCLPDCLFCYCVCICISFTLPVQVYVSVRFPVWIWVLLTVWLSGCLLLFYLSVRLFTYYSVSLSAACLSICLFNVINQVYTLVLLRERHTNVNSIILSPQFCINYNTGSRFVSVYFFTPKDSTESASTKLDVNIIGASV